MSPRHGQKPPGAIKFDTPLVVFQRLLDLADQEAPDAFAARADLRVGLRIANDLGSKVREAARVCNATVEVITTDPTALSEHQADAREVMPLHARQRLVERSPCCWVANGC